MKIKETLKLIYWLIFQDGISIIQERLIKLERYERRITSQLNMWKYTLPNDKGVMVEVEDCELIKWIKNELGKLYNQTNNDSVHRRLDSLESYVTKLVADNFKLTTDHTSTDPLDFLEDLP